MLQIIRERFTGPVALFFIGAIGIALVVSFGNMDTDAITGGFAAKVNGDEIPITNFNQAYQNQLLQQQELVQSGLTAELQEALQRNVLENLVQTQVVSQYIDETGYYVPDETVIAFIRSLPTFQVGGEFSDEGYRATLASQGLVPEGFEREQRQYLEVRQFENAIVGGSIGLLVLSLAFVSSLRSIGKLLVPETRQATKARRVS